MSRYPKKQRGSCREKELANEREMCSACFEVHQHRVEYWKRRGISTENRCFRLDDNLQEDWRPQNADAKYWLDHNKRNFSDTVSRVARRHETLNSTPAPEPPSAQTSTERQGSVSSSSIEEPESHLRNALIRVTSSFDTVTQKRIATLAENNRRRKKLRSSISSLDQVEILKHVWPLVQQSSQGRTTIARMISGDPSLVVASRPSAGGGGTLIASQKRAQQRHKKFWRQLISGLAKLFDLPAPDVIFEKPDSSSSPGTANPPALAVDAAAASEQQDNSVADPAIITPSTLGSQQDYALDSDFEDDDGYRPSDQPQPSSNAAVIRQGRQKREQRKSMQFKDESERREQEAKLVASMGATTLGHVRQLQSASDRRPFLAPFHGIHRRKAVCSLLDIDIRNQEWKNIGIHQRWPGSFHPVQKEPINRMRVDPDLLLSLLRFLDSPGNLQKYAYGQSLRAVLNDTKSVSMQKVDRAKPIENLTFEFLTTIDGEMAFIESGFVPDDRCHHCERSSFRRCMKACGHTDGHHYTPKGSVSERTVRDLISSLTDGDIKSLSGLDDVKVQKGRDNFERLREIVNDGGILPHAEKQEMVARIDKAEIFYQTDYIPHLHRVGTFSCSCLTCGFHDKEHPSDIVCPEKDNHMPPCSYCADSYCVIIELKEKAEACLARKVEALKSAAASNLSEATTNGEGGDANGYPANDSNAKEEDEEAVHHGDNLFDSEDEDDNSIDTLPPIDESVEIFERELAVLEAQAGYDDDDDEEREDEELPIVNWQLLSLPQLREECSTRNLKASGTKQKLISRLLNFEDGGAAAREKFQPLSIEALKREMESRGLDPKTDREESIESIVKYDDLKSWSVDELKNECRQLELVVGGKKEDLVKRIMEASQNIPNPYQDIGPLAQQDLLYLQDIGEIIHDLDTCMANLTEYRGHLARHKSEDAYAKKELAELKDDEAVITSDYKMKILACYFRENQKRWYAKRGTTLLGFMIVTNSPDGGNKKDVKFVMMVSDDACQDEQEVMCAKAVVYADFLPPSVWKVRFTSDGAGCFKSQTHRAAQPFWKIWVGIDEISYRITPAGDGKSCLDGMFGRMNVVLQTAVNSGSSYYNAQTICDAIENSNGLSATDFCTFEPDRSSRLFASINMNFEAVLLTTLDENRSINDNSLLAFKHSGYGSGILINPLQNMTFSIAQNDSTEKMSRSSAEPIVLYDDTGAINREQVLALKPLCKTFEARSNAKAHLESTLSESGTGPSSKPVRLEKRNNRIDTRVGKKKDAIEERRSAMRDKGIYLCNARCSETGRYCTAKFLREASLDKHTQHMFPKGIRAKDFLLMRASVPGGVLASGGRIDRSSLDVVQSELIPVADDSGAGASLARSFGAFNRKPNAKPYRKPKRLMEVLEELYAMRPKLRANEMRAKMKSMVDPSDGGLLFCFPKRFSTGLLLSEDQIQSWITQRAQKDKSKDSGDAEQMQD